MDLNNTQQTKNMYVIKRNGDKQKVSFDKITERLSLLSEGLDVNHILIAQKTIQSVVPGITTKKLDEIAILQHILIMVLWPLV